LVPMLDASITTLVELPEGAPPQPSTVVTPSMVADRLDVVAAIGPDGSARMRLTDGTELSIEPTNEPNDALKNASAPAPEGDVSRCERCFRRDQFGHVARLRVTSAK